jgi:uncharacterized membrane protein (Fun14 family)
MLPHPPMPHEHLMSAKDRLVRGYHLLPAWTRKLLGVSLILGLLGTAGQIAGATRPKTRTVEEKTVVEKKVPAPAPAPAPSLARPGSSSGFVGTAPPPVTSQPAVITTTKTVPIPPTVTEQSTPWVTRIGFSLFVGIVFGLVFRTFIKVSAMVTAAALAGVAALSYFHIVDLDKSAVRSEVTTGLGWVRHAAWNVKDETFHRLPSAGAAGVGFFFGLRRR